MFTDAWKLDTDDKNPMSKREAVARLDWILIIFVSLDAVPV